MNDPTPESPTDPARPTDSEPDDAGAESPVGDMFAEGQTEIGPLPSLTHIENLAQADLPAAAKDVGDEKSPRET